MRIEFSYWPANTEVKLIEDDGRVKDTFYTATRKFPFCMVPNSPQCDYEQTFRDLESVMGPPVIAGEWAHLHPYWHEREQRRGRG
jgi:hypothetical protein